MTERSSRPGLTLPPEPAKLVGFGVISWVMIQAIVIGVGLALVGRHGGGRVQSLDDSVHDWFISHRGGLIGISKIIAVIGDAPKLGLLVVVATCAALVCGWRNGRLRWRTFGPFVAFIGAEATVYAARLVIHRPRPLSAVYPNPGAVAGVHETSWSFPSGHATGSMAVLIALAAVLACRYGWRWCHVAAVVIAVGVATTRLVLGVHWFSDVTVGALAGGAWGIVVGVLIQRSEPTPRPDEPFTASAVDDTTQNR